ncbi:hypothetical protein BDV24DRAFT_174966 [Aspergillus arachidicola]|uniref:Uncharacterized protein n=1 Tax=Aspergillus arachidicola TaxID=656916 RepID=A0A5N6Y8D8_9EURO|nr:hypothetical protein BDV24DRAFT_174966 [Aspergillus arachidicola]
MHLDHKIPWNTISSHFGFIKEIQYKNCKDDFFATTERTKYPPSTALPTSGPLFDTSILPAIKQKYHLEPHRTNSAVSNPLCGEFQNVNHWISQAPYSTADGNLADAIPLATLDNLSWGYSFGVNHLPDVALQAYLLLNIATAVKANAKRGSADDTVRLTETQRFRYFADWALADHDNPAQNIPHRQFWNAKGITDIHCSSWDPLSLETDVERAEMKAYLKMCFELLYGWMERILGILRLWGARSVTINESGFCFA